MACVQENVPFIHGGDQTTFVQIFSDLRADCGDLHADFLFIAVRSI